MGWQQRKGWRKRRSRRKRAARTRRRRRGGRGGGAEEEEGRPCKKLKDNEKNEKILNYIYTPLLIIFTTSFINLPV